RSWSASTRRVFWSAPARARPTSTVHRTPATSIAHGFRAISSAGWSPSSATRPWPHSARSSTLSTQRIARRSAVSRRRTRVKRADRVFTMMLGLALASSAILLALLLTLAPRVEQLAARGAEDTADVVAALVLLLAVCGISLGLLTLFRQLVATAVLIRGLVAQKIPLPSVVVVAASGLDLDGRIDVVTDERPFSFCRSEEH